jgi:hypothetical protein
MSAILTFLGGSAFRAIFGEVSAWLTKKQDAKIELERMKLQNQLDDAASVRNLNAIRLQAELGVKTIEVQSDADQAKVDAEAFKEAMERANMPTGIKWVDAWNATVRPSFATVALFLWTLSLSRRDWTLNDWDLSLIGAIAGYFFADRMLGKRGK